jgi:uncharacterized protein (TIGR03067 family)
MRALLLFSVLAVAVPDRQDPSVKDVKPLQEELLGDWLLVKHTNDGGNVDPNGLTMVFTRESLHHVYLRNGTKEPGGTFPYSLDATKKPAVISFRTTKYEGILKVERDTLTICFSRHGENQPPTQFASFPNTGANLLQATRIKK